MMKQSDIRTTHNNMKRDLILGHLEGCKTILDMGFGRGGDLPKYKQLNASSIVGIDPDESSLNESIERAKNLDMSDVLTIRHGSTDQIYHPTEKYDAIVSNFAFHYFFEHEKYLKGVLETFKKVLRPGGKFIGIVPDAIKVLNATTRNGGRYEDREGNGIFRNPDKTGWGNYNEQVAFTVKGPFYDGKAKMEPLCYMDNFFTEAMKVGFKPVDQGPVSDDVESLSHIYTWFVFTV